MHEDPRCCGSGTCIIDADGRCWCGQQWDGERMGAPGPAVSPNRPSAHDTANDSASGSPDGGRASSSPALSRRAAATRRTAVASFASLALFAAWLVAPALAAAATGTALSEQDARGTRTVIEAQLAAFVAGDAERAFSYASDAIRAQFGDAATFLAMVRAGYPMMLRPARVAFFAPYAEGGAVRQRVRLRDRAGRLWLAVYDLERQAGGGWRINGCAVETDTDTASS